MSLFFKVCFAILFLSLGFGCSPEGETNIAGRGAGANQGAGATENSSGEGGSGATMSSSGGTGGDNGNVEAGGTGGDNNVEAGGAGGDGGNWGVGSAGNNMDVGGAGGDQSLQQICKDSLCVDFEECVEQNDGCELNPGGNPDAAAVAEKRAQCNDLCGMNAAAMLELYESEPPSNCEDMTTQIYILDDQLAADCNDVEFMCGIVHDRIMECIVDSGLCDPIVAIDDALHFASGGLIDDLCVEAVIFDEVELDSFVGVAEAHCESDVRLSDISALITDVNEYGGICDNEPNSAYVNETCVPACERIEACQEEEGVPRIIGNMYDCHLSCVSRVEKSNALGNYACVAGLDQQSENLCTDVAACF